MTETSPQTIHYTACPVCGSQSIYNVLTVKDHSVSQETFPVWQCDNCQARFTQDIPDEASIDRYYQSEEYISHSNTSNGVVNQIYQQVRRYTLGQKKRKLELLTKSSTGNLLDIGCGTGELAGLMARSGWRVVGLEPSRAARRQALEQQRIEAYSSEKLFELPDNDFDVVTLWHTLEHVHQLHDYLSHIKRVLKPGGYVVIAVPNYQSPDGQNYGADWAAYDVPRHLYHFSPKSMEMLLGKHGYTLEHKLNMDFDAFYVSMLSEKYRGNGPELITGGVQGLKSYFKTWDDPDHCSSVMYIAKA